MWKKVTVKLTKNSSIAEVESSTTQYINIADALIINSELFEIVEVHAKQLILRNQWPNDAATFSCSVLPTYGNFNQAVREIRLLRENMADNIRAIETWGTEKGTVTFKGEDGEEHVARTLQQMDADASAIFADLGSAASRDVMTSPTDMETPNALMPRGAGGLLSSTGILTNDEADIPEINMFHWLGTGGTGEILPQATYGCITTTAANRRSHTMAFGENGRVFHIRKTASGAQVAPVEFYHSGNMTISQSRTDSTLGRVSRVGDHGFGVAIPLVTGLDPATPNGLDFHNLDYGDYSGSVGGVINGPAGPTFFGTVSVRKRFDVPDRKVIKASLISGISTSRSWVKFQTVDGWSPWYLRYDQSSAVGVVSQVEGVPTGAIAQKGVNPNGSFTRLLDGTLIMRKTLAITGDGTDEYQVYLTFPTVSTTDACVSFSASVFGTTTLRVAEFRVPFLVAGLAEFAVRFKFNQAVLTDQNIMMSFTVNGTWY